MKNDKKIDQENASMSRMNEYFNVGTMGANDKKAPRAAYFDRELRLDELAKKDNK